MRLDQQDEWSKVKIQGNNSFIIGQVQEFLLYMNPRKLVKS